METVFKEILDRLKAEVPELRYIGADDGQVDQLQEDSFESWYTVLFPAALIDIADIDWVTTDMNHQTGAGVITIRYAWLSPNRFDNNVSDTRLTEATDRWAVAKKISSALHGFSGTNFGYMERTGSIKEKREGLLKVMEISFNSALEEDL